MKTQTKLYCPLLGLENEGFSSDTEHRNFLANTNRISDASGAVWEEWEMDGNSIPLCLVFADIGTWAGPEEIARVSARQQDFLDGTSQLLRSDLRISGLARFLEIGYCCLL